MEMTVFSWIEIAKKLYSPTYHRLMVGRLPRTNPFFEDASFICVHCTLSDVACVDNDDDDDAGSANAHQTAMDRPARSYDVHAP